MKRLPIGVSDFEKIVKGGYYYVDKTMIIKDVIELPGEVKLITRPRRFGKTLNMDTLRRFFSIKERENLFEGFAIWNEKGLVEDYLHKYPVISISFKDVKEISWEAAEVHLKNLLSSLIIEHMDLNVKGWLRKKLEDMVEGRGVYTEVLKLLSWALHEATGKKVIVLIDEYDVPIEAAYTYRHKDPDYYDNMVAFMRGLLTAALKDNEHLELGVLTGVFRVAKESIFSGLNNLETFTIFDSVIEDRFGFTEEEVVEMLSHYGLSEEDKRVIDEWYGGYIVGERELYNPWSVVKYISERVTRGRDVESAAQPFWINTSSNDLIIEQIQKNPNLQEEIDRLLKGEEIVQILDPSLSLRELENKMAGVWTLLASGGYLSARRVSSFNRYALKIPNEELRYFFKDSVMVWIESETKFSMSLMLSALYEMLEAGRYDRFEELLENYITNALSYFDAGGREPERVYKAFLLGILSIAMNGFVVESEMESGYGRLDVVIYPKEKRYGRYAVIFEVKRAEGNLENAVKEALEQIKRRKYFEKVKRFGYNVIAFGIAFRGKRVKMIAERVDWV